MTIEDIEELIDIFGAHRSNAMHCSHVGENYDQRLIDISYNDLINAIEEYASDSFDAGQNAVLYPKESII